MFFDLSFKKKIIYLLIILIISLLFTNYICLYLYNANLSDMLIAWGTKDMGGRSFDKVSNFSNFGIYGIFLKTIVWPFLFLTGTFAFVSFNFFYIILFVEILALNFIYFLKYKKIIFSLELYCTLMLISFYVSAFTAYFRYSYIAFVIFIVHRIYQNEKQK